MKIIKSAVFEDEDEPLIKKVVEFCNMAFNFFAPETREDQGGDKGGLQKVMWLRQGHALSYSQLMQIREAINVARINVQGRRPHRCFLAETKREYVANLEWAMKVVGDWAWRAS